MLNTTISSLFLISLFLQVTDVEFQRPSTIQIGELTTLDISFNPTVFAMAYGIIQNTGTSQSSQSMPLADTAAHGNVT
jgi:hypothetical protein